MFITTNTRPEFGRVNGMTMIMKRERLFEDGVREGVRVAGRVSHYGGKGKNLYAEEGGG